MIPVAPGRATVEGGKLVTTFRFRLTQAEREELLGGADLVAKIEEGDEVVEGVDAHVERWTAA
jgi:hypothetical protein